ncbi:hypothetical protein [Roseiconus lacunae]
MRVAAYQELIHALSDLLHTADTYLEAHYDQQDLTSEAKQRISRIRSEQYPKIRRAADSGAFLFSHTVCESLKKFMTQEDDEKYSSIINLENEYGRAKACLEAVVTASKKDLSTRWWWL